MAISMDDIARQAAERLSRDFGQNFPAVVEAKLRYTEPPKSFEPLAIAISLAALVVSASKAAWDVYRDLKKDREPTTDIVASHLRRTLKVESNISIEQRDKVIFVVADELVKTSPKG
jgi:hypothetical protein